MKEKNDRSEKFTEGRKILEGFLQDQRDIAGPLASVFFTVLDSNFLYQKKELMAEDLQAFFVDLWPEFSLHQALTDLQNLGLLTGGSSTGYAVAKGLQAAIASEMERHFAHSRVLLSDSDITFQELMDGFEEYARSEIEGTFSDSLERKILGGRTYLAGGSKHHILLRPYPLTPQPHSEDYVLILCRLLTPKAHMLTKLYIRNPSLRRGVAIYDLGKTEKINLTRSEVFVHFERYIRRRHGLRISPNPEITQGLVDSGLLSLRMG